VAFFPEYLKAEASLVRCNDVYSGKNDY
jgi:hypothetical protein